LSRVVNIPKQVSKTRIKFSWTMGSSSHVEEELNYVSNVSGSHRNPKYWPTKPSKPRGRS
jgi:hypothetical protein